MNTIHITRNHYEKRPMDNNHMDNKDATGLLGGLAGYQQHSPLSEKHWVKRTEAAHSLRKLVSANETLPT